MTNPTVAALLRERAGYLARGLPERVAAVDEELARLGHVQPGPPPETTALAPPPETATPPRPAPRRSKPDAQG